MCSSRHSGPGRFPAPFFVQAHPEDKTTSPDFVEMFLHEARIAALLNHPNIVQVLRLRQVDGDYFLAMEYLRGRDLLAVSGKLSARAAPGPAWRRSSRARSPRGGTTRTS